eukprot:scaffold118624_cov57-Phaeocystis_antarctica.AAC.3
MEHGVGPGCGEGRGARARRQVHPVHNRASLGCTCTSLTVWSHAHTGAALRRVTPQSSNGRGLHVRVGWVCVDGSVL